MLNHGVLNIDAVSGLVSTCPLSSFPEPRFNGGTPTNDIGQLVVVPVPTSPAYVGGLLYDQSGAIVVAEQVAPTLSLDLLAAPLDPRISFSRGSIGTFFDDSGNLVVAQNDVPRFDHSADGAASIGLLIEEGRTNSVRNNTMVGAVAGTPGVLPTYWSGAYPGLTQQVVGVGKQNGIDYTDVRFFGTSGVASSAIIVYETSTRVAATLGQAWAHSVFLKLVAGDLDAVSFNLRTSERDAAGALVGSTNGPSLSIGPVLSRYSLNAVLSQANTAYVLPQIIAVISVGAQVDFTLRVGMPQLELGEFPTSVIPTSGDVVTRGPDVASMTGTNFSDWFNPTEGTFFWKGSMVDATEAASRLLTVDDGTGANNIRFVSAGFQVLDGEAVQTNLTVASPSNNVPYTMVGAYRLNDFAASSNGGTTALDTLGTVPTVDRMRIGAASTVLPTCCHVEQVEYFPTRLTNAQVQELSGGGLSGEVAGYSSGLAVDYRGALVVEYGGSINSWVSGLPVNADGVLCTTQDTPPSNSPWSGGFSEGFGNGS